jgi:hypothetical protein
MNRMLLIFMLCAFCWSCKPGSGGANAPLPQACALLTADLIGDILREPAKNPTPTNASLGEQSACTYELPGRSREDYLGIYVYASAPTIDMYSLKNIADEWKLQNTGAAYEVLDNAKYPMAWFPGEHKVYPSTFIILFRKATLVITGVAKDDAKSIAFRAMVQHKLDQ